MNWNDVKERYTGKTHVIDGILHQIVVEIKMSEEDTHIDIHIRAFGFDRLTLQAEYRPTEDKIKICNVDVAKEHRCMGYGSVAMNILFAIGDSMGISAYSGFLGPNDLDDPDDPHSRKR